MSVTIDDVMDLTHEQVCDEHIGAVSELLLHANNLFKLILEANRHVGRTVGVAGALLDRVFECGTSITILAQHNRFRDVAVLLVTLMELRVDLQFIALSPERETVWQKHANEWRKPWKMDLQLGEIFKDAKELQAEKDMHHMWCLIKQGSPVKDLASVDKSGNGELVGGDNMAFSITCDGTRMLLEPDNLTRMSGALLFATGYNIRETCYAADRIVSRYGIEPSEMDQKLTVISKRLEKAIERDCMWKILQAVRQQNPQFDQICAEEKRLKIEVEEIRKKLQMAEQQTVEPGNASL